MPRNEISLLSAAALLTASIRVAVSGALGASSEASGGHVTAGLGLSEENVSILTDE